MLYINLINDSLTKRNCEVTTFKKSTEALEHFKLKPDEYDLLITDQIMPDMLGTELTKEILKIRPDMKIILCTGFNSGMDRESVLNMGFKGYLHKPFTSLEFENELNLVLKKLPK